MTTLNAYATLTDFKNWLATRGLSGSVGTDTSDDAVIEMLLVSASRYIDAQTGRTFYPRYETRSFDIPEEDGIISFDDDLLSLTTLTNGDDTTIPSTEYHLLPKNREPKWGITLKDSSTYSWESDSNGDGGYVIDVLGWWGYHERFTQRGWQSVGTLSAAQSSTSSLTFTLTAGHTAVTGQVWKIDTEILNGSITGNTLTAISRGDNGSTAATHLISSTVYAWQPMDEIKTVTLQIVERMNSNRSGQASAGSVSVTASGVVIRPEDVPPMAQATIDHYMRLTG